MVDHGAHGGAGRLHQIGLDAGGRKPATGVHSRRQRAGRAAQRRRAQLHPSLDRDPDRRAHLALEAGHAHLPVALRRVRVTQREQATRRAQRQVERRAPRHVTQVDVAAAGVRRRNRHIVHAGTGHADGTAERLDGDSHTRHELGRVTLGEVEDLQVRLVELAGRQQAEARQDQRPTPLGQLEVEELDGEHVARLGTRHMDRAGQRVDGVEVEAEQVVGCGVAPDLPAREVIGLDHDDVARLHMHHRLVVDVPAPVGGHVTGDHMLGHWPARV